jgi:hypothetical protein
VSTYRSIDLVDGWLSAEREYVEGVDVGTAVTSTGPAPLEVAAEITRAVVAGIRAVHGAGFVAGRASPSHVLVGRDGRTLLLHAGLPDVGAHSPRDRANQVDREVAFAPPERFAGSANDARSDVFSAASLMLLLVAGRPVIPRGHRLARVLARRGVHVVPDGEALPDVDGALGAILSLALRAEPEARPGIDALEEALASRAASADEVAGWTRAVLGNAALGDGRA